jgi:hypothetical protein
VRPASIVYTLTVQLILTPAGDFYVSKGLMKRYADAAAFAADVGISLESILTTFAGYGAEGDPFGDGNGLSIFPFPMSSHL